MAKRPDFEPWESAKGWVVNIPASMTEKFPKVSSTRSRFESSKAPRLPGGHGRGGFSRDALVLFRDHATLGGELIRGQRAVSIDPFENAVCLHADLAAWGIIPGFSGLGFINELIEHARELFREEY